MTKSPKPARGNIKVRPITAQERIILAKKISKRHERLRNRYPEIHGKVVDWVSHCIEEGTLYVNIRFKDKTDFSFEFSPQIVTDGIDLGDMSTGNFKMIREYYRRRTNDA